MAKLHRIAKLDDKFNSHVYTFLLPVSLAADNARDIMSSEFTYANHKWNISLEKKDGDRQIGAYVTLKNATPGLYVIADYGFCLLNKLHYTSNEAFTDTNISFSKHKLTQGRKSFVSAVDIRNPAKGFLIDKDQLLLEVTLCNVRTHFEYQLQLPMSEVERSKYPPNDLRLETGPFIFGGSEWTVNIRVNERNVNDVRGGSTVFLKRLSNHEHYCKLKYRIHIGVIEPTPLPGQPVQPKPINNPNTNKVIISSEMESLFIDKETQDKLVLPASLYKLATIKGVITVRVECYNSIILTLLQIPMDKNRHKALRCYDPEKRAWHFEAHMKSDKLKFYIFYSDIATIPRGCIRVVNIGVCVLPAYGNTKQIRAVNAPYCKYYTQKHQDDFGLEVPTGILMKDIVCERSIFIYDNTNSLTVQVEWGDSYMLKETDYSTADNIPRLHKMQMFREMQIIQKENLVLEKQVHSYQTAIAHKDSKGEFDPTQVAHRPPPTGQAQISYTDCQTDPYLRGQERGSSTFPTVRPSHDYTRQNIDPPQLEIITANSYVDQDGYTQGGYEPMNRPSTTITQRDQLAMPGGRPQPRSRSADPHGQYPGTPRREQRLPRRNSAGELLPDCPDSYGRQPDERNRYDGYPSDSGQRSDRENYDIRYGEPYAAPQSQPSPRSRSLASRNEYSDYCDRPKVGYPADMEMDQYSDRSAHSTRAKRSSAGMNSASPRQVSQFGSNAGYAGSEMGPSSRRSGPQGSPSRSSDRYGRSYRSELTTSRQIRNTGQPNGYD